MSVKVYVAGSISDPNPAVMLCNIKNGIRESTRLLLKGYAPFCPFLDHQFFFQLQNGEQISVAQIREYSMEWLRVCDVVLVLPGSEHSVGVAAEVAEANRLQIPVVYNEADIKILQEEKRV